MAVALALEPGDVPPTLADLAAALDHPARCAVYTAAVREFGRSGDEPTDLGRALLEACVRMNGRRW